MLIVKEIYSADDIKAVLCHPDIYTTITGDKDPPIDTFEPPVTNEYLYVGGFADGEIIALMVYHAYRDGKECHVQVIPTHRAKYAREFTERALMFRGELPLYATVPDKYLNVLDFGKSIGFKVIERIENDLLKDGVLYSSSVLRYQDGIY